jgi:hypothetical protein
MASRLSDSLVRDGTLPADVVRVATARQAVYGGTLDTALLELGVLDEPTLWSALAQATGVPIPDPTLFENPDPRAAALFDSAWSRKCRAVPVAQRDGMLLICCSEPLDPAQLEAARAALGLSFEVYVVPEVRLAAARHAVYGEPMPPRLLRVLARLLGAQPVRRWVKALGPERVAPKAQAQEGAPTVAADDANSGKAEFEVPLNTFTAEAGDIIESRPSAAADVARALDGDGAVPELASTKEITARGRVRLAEAVATTASGPPGLDTQAVAEAAETLPGRTSSTVALATAAEPAALATAVEPAALVMTGDPVAPAMTGEPVALAMTGEPVALATAVEPAALVMTGDPVALVTTAGAAANPHGDRVFDDTVSDAKEEQLCLIALDAQAGARLAALRVLRTRIGRPRVRQLAEKLRTDLAGSAGDAVLAAGALGELADGQAVPALIEALGRPPSVAQTAARALVEIAKQDFGQSKKKWLAWWQAHKRADRVDWLLEGLSNKAPEIRFSSSEELRAVTGEYFGYHFDLPKKQREEARERWQTWWYQSGRARLPDRR